MNSLNILVWLSTVVIILALGIRFYFRKKNKEQKTFSVLTSFAKENNCSISSSDHWDKTLIGIDNSENNKLFFVRTINGKEFKAAINISEVKNCRLVKTARSAHYHKENVSVIDKIELVFSFVNTRKADIALEFYNSEYDLLTLTRELLLAQKWLGTVNSILAQSKTAKAKYTVQEVSLNRQLVGEV